MAKSKDKQPAKAESRQNGDKPLIKVDKKAFDSTLASLFASSAGPVQAPPKSRYQARIETENDEELSEIEDDDSEAESEASEDEDASDDEEMEDASDDSSENEDSEAEDSVSENEAVLERLRETLSNGVQEKPAKKKRKRGEEEEVEDTYLRKLAREEEKEEEQRQKKRKMEKAQNAESDDEDSSDESQPAKQAVAVPKHESLTEASDRDAQEVEKAGRTVFLGNVSTECINSKSTEKALKKHLESFIADLADNDPPHKVESIRYRSTAFDNSLPKRAAYAKKEIMDSTTRSTNAYAVYTTKVAAREAVKKLNGSVFLKRHMHVDSVAHPAKVDHRRCVFVGNLPFVDDESQTPTAEGEKKKGKPASDVEEGLWTHFAKAGKIESVRVVRDAATRVGKGFAYVQYYDENGVEAALHYNEQKYPPMLPRKLRVTRCRAEKKNKKDKPRVALPSTDRKSSSGGKAGYKAKLTDEQKSTQGRARSMLGKVAKAQTKEGFVFEGHRAKEGQGKSGLKFKGSGGKKKGPNGRKSRSSAWKKGGKGK
ncbi:nucleolar protein 12 [Paraphoma chrysanthemicola]|uniref:Nucleolar protein 12 n=1 Tax=Paraphoma chrysanthemicola TaxID=798071 RepID=A0A8K0VY01_9PLEO|nr:nucleolar protein 12 [Paraphoma chrysanthemicola]